VETCIRIQREAINHETLDRGHPETRGLLNNLGSFYMTAYRDTGDVTSPEASRNAFQEAITMGDEAGDADHPLQLERLSNLGAVHYELYYQTKPESTKLLEEALQFFRRAVNASKEDYPNRAAFQTVQGMICEDLPYLEEAYEAFAQSANNPYALPSIRLQSARSALRITAGKGEWDKAISLAKNASKLLPLVCSRYISLRIRSTRSRTFLALQLTRVRSF
jgi:tetratricopeptide (TPR) repeat protein